MSEVASPTEPCLACDIAAGTRTLAGGILLRDGGFAVHALAGEIALRARRLDDAVGHFQAGVAIEDGMRYEEPPLWYYSLRQSLGRALLEAGRPADAEAAYREDLKKFPENGWSLFGLAQALRAQGKLGDAAPVEARFRRAWAGADVTLEASRF